jgi:hypothetical protein
MTMCSAASTLQPARCRLLQQRHHRCTSQHDGSTAQAMVLQHTDLLLQHTVSDCCTLSPAVAAATAPQTPTTPYMLLQQTPSSGSHLLNCSTVLLPLMALHEACAWRLAPLGAFLFVFNPAAAIRRNLQTTQHTCLMGGLCTQRILHCCPSAIALPT